MSNIVEQINDSITSLVATELGVNYSPLAYIYNIIKNTANGTNKAYGVKPGVIAPSISITKFYTAEQEFVLTLTDQFNDRDGDEGTRASVFELYSKIDDILKVLVNTKAGLPSIVLNIPSFAIAEIEIDEEEKIIILNATFSVKYRQSLI